jgi:hypothetical protein
MEDSKNSTAQEKIVDFLDKKASGTVEENP